MGVFSYLYNMKKSVLKKIIKEAWIKKGDNKSSKVIKEEYVLKNLENEFPVEIQLYDKGTHLELDKILVYPSTRGVGVGSEIMTKIGEYADMTGQSVFLTPSTSYGGTSLNRLKKFYKKFGYKDVEDVQDKALSKNMLVRHPKVDENIDPESQKKHKGKSSPFGSGYKKAP